jgi:hypothetical protein
MTFMNPITEVVYDFIANDESAMECFEQATGAIDDGLDELDLGGFIRNEFLNLMTADNEMMGLIRRMDEQVDWPAIGRRLQSVMSV